MNRPLQRWILLAALLLVLIVYFVHQQSNNFSVPFLTTTSGPLKPIDWSKVPQRNRLSKESYLILPADPPKALPQIQANFGIESESESITRWERQSAVRSTFIRSWNAYRQHAWGHDEFAPITGAWKDHFGGWGASMIDSLDTLVLMNLGKEFQDALAKIRDTDFSTTHMRVINVYESTVRILGGLLGAHELASERRLDDGGVLLKKAKELAEMLYHAFDTENRMPVARFDWQRAAEGKPEEQSAPYAIAAEIAMGLEFTRLSQITSDSRFYDAVQRVSNVLAREQTNGTKLSGMWPVVFNTQRESFSEESIFTLGGRADSLYETIPKMYMLLGGQSEQHKKMYLEFLETACENLFFKPMTPNNLDILLSGSVEVKEQKPGNETVVLLKPEGQHLSCFVGGMVAIGSKIFSRPGDLEIAKKLVDGCVWAYESTETGIMPEVFTAVAPVEGAGINIKNKWDKKRWLAGITAMYPIASPEEVKEADVEARAEKIAEQMRFPKGMVYISDRRYMLRPQAIESVFIMYRITGDTKYQDIAWKMFQDIQSATSTTLSYSSISDVTQKSGEHTDASESFWMGETLKYFYLIFSEPHELSLDSWVLNTNSHPLKIPKP